MYLHNEKEGGFFELSCLPFIAVQENKEYREPIFLVNGQTTRGQTIVLASFKDREEADTLLNLIALGIQEDDYSSVIHIGKDGAVTRTKDKASVGESDVS